MNISLNPFETALALAAFALLYSAYGREGLRLWREGGAVRAQGFVVADLLAAIALATYFGLVVFEESRSKAAAPGSIKIDQVLPNTLFMLAIALGVCGFLVFRGADLVEAFGLRRISALRAVGLAVFFYAGTLPIVFAVSNITRSVLGGEAEEQSLVLLFRAEVQAGHYSGVATILVAGVALAPLAEEILFRGFFYGVLKRFIGGLGAAVLSALLFAAFHMNLASLPGLFVLALSFVFAYERSGSIFVPLGMHALFNFCNLLALLYAASPAKHG